MSSMPRSHEELTGVVRSILDQREQARKELSLEQRMAVRKELEEIVGWWARVLGISSIGALVLTVASTLAYVVIFLPDAAFLKTNALYETKFQTRISDFERSMTELDTQVRTLRDNKSALEKELGAMQGEKSRLGSQIADLEADRVKLSARIEHMKTLTTAEVEDATLKVKGFVAYVKDNPPAQKILERVSEDEAVQSKSVQQLVARSKVLGDAIDLLAHVVDHTMPQPNRTEALMAKLATARDLANQGLK